MTASPKALHPYFVGELENVDLRALRGPAAFDELRAFMDEFAVLVVRDQHFEGSQQAEFARRFDGELLGQTGRSVVAGNERLGDTALTDISNLDDDGVPLKTDDRRRLYSLGNRLWHTDATYQAPPGRYSMLWAKTVASHGGETEYADMRAAYDSLPPSLKAQIAGLRAFHSIVYSRQSIGFTDFKPEESAALAGAEQPLVRTNPRTGRKSVYLASHAAHVVGWPVPDGRLLLRELTALATLPQFVYRHHWRVHDFVIWDNRATMHRGRPFDETIPRDMRRVTTLDTDP